MRAHILIDNVVVNNVDVEHLNHPDGLMMVWAEESSDIGWTLENGHLVDLRPKPEAPVTPVVQQPTKEQLLAQLQALQAQIESLE